MLAPWKKSFDQPRQHIKKQRHYFANKGPSSQSYGFSSSHVWMWELDHKEGWVLKIWCFWSVVLEKTLESPLDSKEIQLLNPKGNQSWIFTGRTNVEAEIPIVWPLDAKSQLTGKDSEAGKDWRQEEKGVTEDEMVGWHHQLNGHEFEQVPEDGEGQGSLVCCSPWDEIRLQHILAIQFSSVQSLSRVRHFATPWTTAHRASLSIANSWTLLKLKSVESMIPSNHLILCRPLLL